MPIEPIAPMSRGGCDARTDRFESVPSHIIPIDWQSHSLAWLDRHYPVAAAHLRSRLAEMTLLRQASLAYHPVDCWTKSDVEKSLYIQSTEIDAYASRNLISQTLHDELEIKEADITMELVDVHQPQIDERLIPAGIPAIPIDRQPHKSPVKTSPKVSVLTEPSKSAGWIRISMIVLVCLFVEGLLTKWLLG